jgi:hypothetical protein
VRLSANTGICEHLRGGECEAEREHWYLRASESRPQGNTGICEDLRVDDAGEHGGPLSGVGHPNPFLLPPGPL